MGVPTLKRRELKNPIVSFIPLGEVVDSTTTSLTTWPDNDPATNWTDYAIPDIESLTEEITTEDEPFLRGQNSGGWQNEPERHLRMLLWKLVTTSTSSYMKKLQYALSAAAVGGVAQSLGVNGQQWIDGVLLVELRQQNGGAIIERFQVAARMTLTNPGAAAGPQTSKLELSFSKLASGNNTYVALT